MVLFRPISTWSDKAFHGGAIDMSARQIAHPRVLRVTFSRVGPGARYAEVSRGTWQLGADPVLTGEPIPPEVIAGLELQMRAANTPAGTVFHDRAEAQYAMEFKELPPGS